MPGLLPNVDPDGLLEFSVVYTDRSVNHMSQAFREVMCDISSGLKEVYGADAVAVVPGGGTYGMEAVARQLATGKRVLVLRNGWFSVRWSQIFEACGIPASETVLTAYRSTPGPRQPFAPAPIEEVVAAIQQQRPDLVFAPHVETASGMILPDDYLRQVAEATHAAGGLFVLDCIASGAVWVDMRELGIDVLISAPQKGWSASPCAALVMLSEAGTAAVESSTSSSFANDLGRWLQIMRAYEGGGHAYHATLPTDGLATFRDALHEAREMGFETAKQRQLELGRRVRALLAAHGLPSVAAEGFGAPGVAVSYIDEGGIVARFAAAGAQVAGGVPLRCGEGEDFQTFRVGLFGLDKLADVDGTVARFEAALGAVRG